jgi:hypothetical protein
VRVHSPTSSRSKARFQLAEEIVGHPLPGSVKMGGNLDKLRAAVAAA